MVFKAGLARSAADREVRAMQSTPEDRARLLAFGPQGDLLMEDDENVTQLYLWGSKKGNEQVNTEMLALGFIRGATVQVAIQHVYTLSLNHKCKLYRRDVFVSQLG